MRLSDFTALIAQMPTRYQSFTAKRVTQNWLNILHREDRAGAAMCQLFGEQESVELSRSDLRVFARQESLDCFVMATLLWGYPDGMRKTWASDISDNLLALTSLLNEARQGIANWRPHFARADAIRGLGLSTYTKFLNFLSVNVSGHTALILDMRISDVAIAGEFEEFTGDYSSKTYPAYLETMHSITADLKVEAESLEFFLYEFGGNLKNP